MTRHNRGRKRRRSSSDEEDSAREISQSRRLDRAFARGLPTAPRATTAREQLVSHLQHARLDLRASLRARQAIGVLRRLLLDNAFSRSQTLQTEWREGLENAGESIEALTSFIDEVVNQLLDPDTNIRE